MVMTLDRPIAGATAVPGYLDDASEAAREITAALMARTPATFVVEARSVADVIAFASPLRMFLLMSGRVSGGVSAAVAPHFSEQTYPALLDLVARLGDSGASDLWRPDGARTVAVGEARQMFVSADMPVRERAMHPDRLLEVVAAHRIPAPWYRERVQPHLSRGSVVRVFYGIPGIDGSAFSHAEAEAMGEEAITGGRRRFTLASTPVKNG